MQNRELREMQMMMRAGEQRGSWKEGGRESGVP